MGLRLDRVAAFGLLFALASSARGDDPASTAFFETKIRPVLVERCGTCHAGDASRIKGGLRLDSRAATRAGGDSGPAVVPGKPDESLLFRAISHANDVSPMPPKGGKLPEAVVSDFRRWIEAGAVDPREGSSPRPAADSGETWWSLRPIVRAPIPTGTGATHPIDAFILARLKSAGLSATPEADRRVLIRRLSVDLLGLIPTPEEVEAFVADTRPDAYERLVDRLLASPHYGERLARHWMDAVHFAETHGHDQDRVRPNAWPYRDYLISAFNTDTPYARFVREQLAADACFPNEPRLVPALGLGASGPWDESSLRDIREDTIDRAIGRYLDRDDIVTTVMSTFVSLTVGCARCHDHKFDPIPQADYYNLQAVFSGVDKAERGFDPDPAVAARRAALNRDRQRLANRDPAFLETLLGPGVRREVDDWESNHSEHAPTWTTPTVERFESAGGATLTRERDGSILSQGKTPSRETVTVRLKTGPGKVAAIRLEVLPDDRLPMKGPGRNPNGNLHLTEIEVFAEGNPKPIRIKTAIADHDQTDWGVAKAIDGNDQTAWGIYPKVGKPHVAVFELERDLEPTPLTVVLKQTYPADHPIGKFRLSLTDGPRPVGISRLPDGIVAVLGTPADRRSREQRIELAAYVVGLRLDRELAALPPERLVYALASDFKPDGSHKPAGKPRPVNILRRGDIRTPGKPAAPGTLSCVSALSATFDLPESAHESLRRKALADWIVDPRNPLTWRSIVNRVWRHHFGQGLVDTPNDFGRMGSPPTHPELLDRLAADFRDGGGSIKALHRLIVTSAAYRRSSARDERAARIDADNRLLWRQNRRRLDAETVRDSVLLASGRLDRTMGGASVRQFDLGPGVHVTPTVNYEKFSWDAPGASRRSVYRFLFRTLPDPFMDALDAADASQLIPARNESLTPLQALALLNNRFMIHQSRKFAESLAGSDDDAAVATLFARALGRAPSADERRDWTAFLRAGGRARAALLLFNSNEFLFVD